MTPRRNLTASQTTATWCPSARGATWRRWWRTASWRASSTGTSTSSTPSPWRRRGPSRSRTSPTWSSSSFPTSKQDAASAKCCFRKSWILTTCSWLSSSIRRRYHFRFNVNFASFLNVWLADCGCLQGVDWVKLWPSKTNRLHWRFWKWLCHRHNESGNKSIRALLVNAANDVVSYLLHKLGWQIQ